MTQSSMLQSLPAPLRSILRDPTAIAVLASIGVHGLLWVTLPYLPLSAAQPTEAEIQREVGLVELSPEESARVPQFDTQASLPIPAAPLPPADAGRLPQQFSITPLPTPPAGSLFPPSSLFVPPIDRSPIIIRPSQSFSRSNTPTTRQTPRSTPAPTPTATATPTPPAATPTPTSTPLPSPTPGETISEEGVAIPGVPDRQETPSPTSTATPSPNEGTNSGNQPNQAPASPTPPRRTDEEIADLRAQQQRDREFIGSYNPEGTSERRGQVTAAIEAWTIDIAPQLPQSDEGGRINRLSINVPTSRETCLVQRPLGATYGVLVDGSGDPIGQPRRLMSTGFPRLDERAIAAVRDFSFENDTGENKPFAVDVRFQYDADECPPIEAPSPPAS